jgi:hypothetical protein
MLHIKRITKVTKERNDLLIAFIVYVNYFDKLQQFKEFKIPTIDFNALLNSLGNSACSSPEVVLAFLRYEGSIIQNASDQLVSCVYVLCVDFVFHPSSQTKI